MPFINAAELPLEKIFSNEYDFLVPSYQRPYSWEEDHVEKLIEDLVEASSAGTPTEDRGYFIGSIVLTKAKIERPDPHIPGQRIQYDGFEVVDGQQRLLTLSIVFAAMRDSFSDRPAYQNTIAERLQRPGEEIRKIAPRDRIVARYDVDAFFHDNVLTTGAIPPFVAATPAADQTEHKERIRANVIKAWTTIRELSHEARVALYQFMVEQCMMVVVTADDQDAAIRIFSVLNDRGMSLSHADIIKAAVLETGEQHERAKVWDSYEERLGREEFQQLLGDIRTIHTCRKADQSLSREVKDSVLPDLAAQGLDFVDHYLKPYGDMFGALRAAHWTGKVEPFHINRRLRRLTALPQLEWVPVAMTWLGREGAPEASFAPFLADLERLAYSMMLRRIYQYERARRMARVIEAIRGADLSATADDIGPLQLTDAEKRATREALNGPVYRITNGRGALLRTLDQVMAGADAVYDRKTATIEHILPQTCTPGGWWEDRFPDPVQRQDILHTLGNLCLLSRRRNARASNKAFPAKRDEYFLKSEDGSYFMTEALRAQDDWTPDAWRARQTVLVELLEAEWRLA